MCAQRLLDGIDRRRDAGGIIAALQTRSQLIANLFPQGIWSSDATVGNQFNTLSVQCQIQQNAGVMVRIPNTQTAEYLERP